MQLVLLKAVGLGADATGIVPALVRLAKAKLLNAGRTPFSRAELARPPDKAETVRACWMSWVQLVLVVYAPLAPLCSAFCLVFAACALLAARVETALGARPHFDSAGLLAAVVARRALLNVAIGALVHLAVLGLAGARGEYSHVFALAPIPLPIAWARARLLARQRDGLHGARGAGRLPLRDAAALDATRPRAHVRAALGAFGHELCAWAPPCGAEGASTAARLVGSAVAQPTAAGALPPPDGEEAQAALSGWLRRYERADAVEYRAQVGAALAAAALTA
jgi:predicted small integral membrane protein